jgi:hypothetical protein
VKKISASITAGNELAARIILGDPVKYAGLMVMWAELWRAQEQSTGGHNAEYAKRTSLSGPHNRSRA